MNLKTELRELRKQVERLQVEVNGRESISAMVVWDGHNGDYVSPVPNDFSGLVVHLTPDMSPAVGTNYGEGISENEFTQLKEQLRREFS